MKILTSLLVCALFLAIGTPALAAAKTPKQPSCTLTAKPEVARAGERVRLTWKAKNATRATWTADAPTAALGLKYGKKLKKSGKQTVIIPKTAANASYRVALAVEGKDKTSAFCTTTIVVEGTAGTRAAIDSASLVPGTASTLVTGTAPPGSTLEVYLAHPDFRGLTDYRNVRADMMFSFNKKVFLGTLMTFDARGKWSARFGNGLPAKSRVFVFDAKKGELLATAVVGEAKAKKERKEKTERTTPVEETDTEQAKAKEDIEDAEGEIREVRDEISRSENQAIGLAIIAIAESYLADAKTYYDKGDWKRAGSYARAAEDEAHRAGNLF